MRSENEVRKSVIMLADVLPLFRRTDLVSLCARFFCFACPSPCLTVPDTASFALVSLFHSTQDSYGIAKRIDSLLRRIVFMHMRVWYWRQQRSAWVACLRGTAPFGRSQPALNTHLRLQQQQSNLQAM